jgi:hypothetical protein
MKVELNTSWMYGKYEGIGEISSLGYIVIEDFFLDGEDYFVQGDEAEAVLEQIHSIWCRYDCSVEDALKIWKHLNQ